MDVSSLEDHLNLEQTAWRQEICEKEDSQRAWVNFSEINPNLQNKKTNWIYYKRYIFFSIV